MTKDLRNHAVNALGERRGLIEGEAGPEEGGLEQEVNRKHICQACPPWPRV